MSLFQSNLRKQIRNLPKILNFVKIIHYYSKLFTGVRRRFRRAGCGTSSATRARTSTVGSTRSLLPTCQRVRTLPRSSWFEGPPRFGTVRFPHVFVFSGKLILETLQHFLFNIFKTLRTSFSFKVLPSTCENRYRYTLLRFRF